MYPLQIVSRFSSRITPSRSQIFQNFCIFEVNFQFRGTAKNSRARKTRAVSFRSRSNKKKWLLFLRSSFDFQLRFLYVISIIGTAGNVLVLIDSAYFWKNYPSGHSLIVNLTLTGKTAYGDVGDVNLVTLL